MLFLKGSFLRGTEQGYSGGSREAWSAEQQRAGVQERVNTVGPRWPFLRGLLAKLGLGWHLEGD